jgi:hypothetical protein
VINEMLKVARCWVHGKRLLYYFGRLGGKSRWRALTWALRRRNFTGSMSIRGIYVEGARDLGKKAQLRAKTLRW